MVRYKDHIQKILDEIVRLHGVVEGIELNKHYKIYWRKNGRKGVHIVSFSPSDIRSGKNSLAQIRRALAGKK